MKKAIVFILVSAFLSLASLSFAQQQEVKKETPKKKVEATTKVKKVKTVESVKKEKSKCDGCKSKSTCTKKEKTEKSE